ncbi:MAG: hypothetical protein NTV24_03340 [Candidatus Woesebacteria bacterium]|nr:hypothetical protein [Candidatus Woesebacteria bacterium]
MKKESCLENKKYSEKEIDEMVDMLADLIIDNFIELRVNKLNNNDIMKVNSNTVRFFNGRLRQS